VTDTRRGQIEHLRAGGLDVLVIGGGINGAGVIRDLALRAAHSKVPLRIGLVEQKHFASGTSGKNSQLIHGGLRYLKYLQLHLVRESLHERSILMKLAPQFVKPLPFLLPMYGVKSRWVYGTGLWMYDRLAGSQAIAPHRMLNRNELAEMEPDLTCQGLTAAAVFYDCAIPSARFVVENILDAIAHGAFAANYVRADGWEREADGRWRVRCTDMLSGEQFEIESRKLVDACGAWSNPGSLRLVRGSHIVIPRVNASEHAIAHFEPNGRIVFVIPWGSRNQLTLVGTTDEDHKAGPDQVHISSEESRYLVSIVHKLFPSRTDVNPVSTFSSLRPLVRASGVSATRASRDHRIWNSDDGILHIAGGKYTTYRLMSEQASDLVCREIAPELMDLHPTAQTPFAPVQRDIGDQMEQHLEDYLFVSTYLGYERRWDRESLMPFASALAGLRGWDEARVSAELDAIVGGAEKLGA
jgi:glycerol-3-phosphate dehydrogenase